MKVYAIKTVPWGMFMNNEGEFPTVCQNSLKNMWVTDDRQEAIRRYEECRHSSRIYQSNARIVTMELKETGFDPYW